jgi:hypothetical protein
MLNQDYTLDSELKARVGQLPSGIQTQAFTEAVSRMMWKFNGTMGLLSRPVPPMGVPPTAGMSPEWQARIATEAAFIRQAVPQLGQVAHAIVTQGAGNAVIQPRLDRRWNTWAPATLRAFSQMISSFEKEVSRAMSNATQNGIPASFIKVAKLADMTAPSVPDAPPLGLSALPMMADDPDYGLGQMDINPMVLGAIAGASLIGLAAWWFSRQPTGVGGYDDYMQFAGYDDYLYDL